MFTGIIEELGRVVSIRRGSLSASLQLAATKVLEGSRLGDSIAVNGVCLTLSKLERASFWADAMPETLKRSTLGRLASGSPVNLERALRVSDRLGGHLVSGHVDGVGCILSVQRQDNASLFRIRAPAELMRYLAPKGSVCVDGISLTICKLDKESFTVSIIPHTLANTTLAGRTAGQEVNIECDLLARYLERLMEARAGMNMPPFPEGAELCIQ